MVALWLTVTGRLPEPTLMLPPLIVYAPPLPVGAKVMLLGASGLASVGSMVTVPATPLPVPAPKTASLPSVQTPPAAPFHQSASE